MEFLPILTVFVLVIGSHFPVQAALAADQRQQLPMPAPIPPAPGTAALNLSPDQCIKIDCLAEHELWLHILLQFVRPYEDRNTTYRGDNNYIYLLDDELYDPNEHSTPIYIPKMDDFTTKKENFTKLLSIPKGQGVLPGMFDPEVREAIKELYILYKGHKGAKEILKVAVNARDYVNENLHMYVLMHVLTYDKDLYGYALPAIYDVFPELFTNGGCDPLSAQCCKIEEYPRDLTEEEWMLSYYREDSAFNDFHGSWHYYNPHDIDGIPISHGELFYYFHNQLLARYNMERLSNGLELVKPLNNWASSYRIPEDYIPPVLTKPNKDSLTRCPNMTLGVLRKRLETYRTTLQNAIDDNELMFKNGSIVKLENDNGIKYVGCALENAQCGDLNVALYGGPKKHNYGIHNNGHDIMSHIGCNSTNVTKPPFGVMGDTWSAVRDPIFFRWHKFVDDVFQSHKKNLPEYSNSKLALDDVSIDGTGVDSFGEEGQLYTYNSTLKMTLWFDQTHENSIYQPTIKHRPFTYTINVTNDGDEKIEVNVRIYLAPRNPEYNYEKLRTLWALMDRFKFTLNHGLNKITRESFNSSVTVPQPKSLRELNDIYKDKKKFDEFRCKPSKCQCGLPEHLLIPRGTPEGMPYQLFIYITKRNNAKDNSANCPDLECSDLCSRDYTRCEHSDGEPMGFPFDRPLTSIETIEDLAKMLPNAMLYNITISYDKLGKKFLYPSTNLCDMPVENANLGLAN